MSSAFQRIDYFIDVHSFILIQTAVCGISEKPGTDGTFS